MSNCYSTIVLLRLNSHSIFPLSKTTGGHYLRKTILTAFPLKAGKCTYYNQKIICKSTFFGIPCLSVMVRISHKNNPYIFSIFYIYYSRCLQFGCYHFQYPIKKRFIKCLFVMVAYEDFLMSSVGRSPFLRAYLIRSVCV